MPNPDNYRPGVLRSHEGGPSLPRASTRGGRLRHPGLSMAFRPIPLDQIQPFLDPDSFVREETLPRRRSIPTKASVLFTTIKEHFQRAPVTEEQAQEVAKHHEDWVRTNAAIALGRNAESLTLAEITAEEIAKLHGIQPPKDERNLLVADGQHIVKIPLVRPDEKPITLGDLVTIYQWLHHDELDAMEQVRQRVESKSPKVVGSSYDHDKKKWEEDFDEKARRAGKSKVKRVWSVPDGEEFPPRR